MEATGGCGRARGRCVTGGAIDESINETVRVKVALSTCVVMDCAKAWALATCVLNSLCPRTLGTNLSTRTSSVRALSVIKLVCLASDVMKSPSPTSGGPGGLGLPLSGQRRDITTYATSHPGYEFVAATAQAAAAKRTFGEPTTPLFCNVAFISSEPNQVRACATSATSCRITNPRYVSSGSRNARLN